MRTRVKFCGLRRAEHAVLAGDLGADAIGLVFYPPSPRLVSRPLAAEISRATPPFVTRVGLFLDPGADEVEQVLASVAVEMLQFHGAETRGFCESFGLPYIKSVALEAIDDLRRMEDLHPQARALLLDSNELGQPGGSGKTFDWSRIGAAGKPIIVAGGLNAANVAEVIEWVQPYGVDVSTGIESLRGEKDAGLMCAFAHEVRRADAARESDKPTPERVARE